MGVAVSMCFLAGRAPAPGAQEPGYETKVDVDGLDRYLPKGATDGDQTQFGNGFTFQVKWQGGGPRIIRASLSGSNHTGICINKGTTTAPDFVFRLGGAVFPNKDWEAEDPTSDIGDYAGTQVLAIRTKTPMAANTWVDLAVHSYDFGGSATLRITADGCEPFEPVQIPTDSDFDRLPDEWEKDQKFFDVAAGTWKGYGFKKGEDQSTGGPDGLSDIDVGYTFGENVEGQAGRKAFDAAVDRARGAKLGKIHNELGDGFNAFEEYRGVFVQSKHKRMDDLKNEGGLTTRWAGPMVKDVFVHDPNSLVKPNVFLMMHGISYHRILLDEMTDSGSTSAPKGGIVNFNGGTSHQQRAIFIRKFAIPKPDVLGNSHSFSINAQPVAIDVDTDEISAHAKFTIKGTGAEDPPDELLDYVVAHEFGHKLDLRHTEKAIVNSGAVLANVYDNGIYVVLFVTPQKTVVWGIFQILVNPSSGAEGLSPLEILPLQADGRVFEAPTAHDSEIVAPIIFHGVFHSARRFRYTPNPAFPGTPLPTLQYWVHTWDLMDWTHEHAGLEPRLSQEQRSKMKIVN